MLRATIILTGQSNVLLFLPPCISPSSPGRNQPAANPSAQTHPCDKSPLKWFLAFPLLLHSHCTSQSPSHHLHCKSTLHQWKFASQKGSSTPWQLLEVIWVLHTAGFQCRRGLDSISAIKGIPGEAEPAPEAGIRINFYYQCEGRLSTHQSQHYKY